MVRSMCLRAFDQVIHTHSTLVCTLMESMCLCTGSGVAGGREFGEGGGECDVGV